MIENGIKFAPVEIANIFSYENNLDNWQQPPYMDISKHFGFHGKNFSNTDEILKLKN